ncbi:Stk1 family PASTA domain-containing Ser/Thr kinase [Halobacillus litoralis]|uniref:Stk1 family PASTA domain-containing Ser/Thr kinase n=1 Tax=Halobacillus litoralis TaxID=45668 RepID=UPI00248FBFE2|nr:Stk1 family PASTA domain-containing Ser/Thr kinase [Halobacillus litoralis]
MLNDRLLNDRYRVQDMIGGGGMANVYLAHDTILDREVAIKVLRLEHGNDEEFIARFHREAQSATSLSHPNIVNIYDVGEEDDIYFMVMEYVDGMTLKQYIQQQSPVDVAEAVDIMRQVTSAIAHAHDNGIVHRDIKPQNILIDHYGHVKVTDFGIAMALSATALTQTNSVLGSVHYLSPEQARGGMATKKSDVYSLGIVFFELLTGRLPFSGESPVAIALKHLQHETPSLKRWNAELPQSVENVVLKSTAKDPFHRYDSVLDMEYDIETSLEPYRLDEPEFTLPTDDEDEKTKAIPVITKESYGEQPEENTIIHTNEHKPTYQEQETKQNVKSVPPVEKKKKKKKVWPWVLTILTLLIIGGLIALFTIPGIIQPANVEMIDVKGKEYEEAYSDLSDLNLDVTRETEYSDEVDEGLVIRTDPEEGMVVKEGSEVTVYSSRGKERATFEDYSGKSFEEVKKELESRGFKSVKKYETTSDEFEKGVIIEHFTPQANAQVIPDETEVRFSVSLGPPKVSLQSFDGWTLEQTQEYLENNGLKSEVTEKYSDQYREGLVMEHSPGASEEVNVGSTVDLVVSRGPKEEPPPPPAQPREEQVSVEIPVDEESEETEQKVLIYVDDSDNESEELIIEETITETKTFEFTLSIAEGEEATYRVMRGEEVFDEGTYSY